MKDSSGRKIDYLRISLTDKCNLRCRYCMPAEGVPYIDHKKILRHEEILSIVRASASLGIKKLRLTGGEPLLRKGIASLMRQLKEVPGIEDLAVTTNGLLLDSMLDKLVDAGLDRINLSLDTLNAENFKRLTRYDGLEKVKRGLFRALEKGLIVKINAVPIQGINDGDLAELVRLSSHGVDVRFIELMPIGCGRDFTGLSEAGIKELLAEGGLNLDQTDGGHWNGPARYYSVEGMRGRVGFISPMTGCFCSSCNRIRLTAEGFLKPCLHSDEGVDLREFIRSGTDQKELTDRIGKYIFNKPQTHLFGEAAGDNRTMNQIGG